MRNIWVILIIIILAGCVDKSTNTDESLQNLNVIANGGFEIFDSYINFAESWQVGSVPSDTYVEIDQTVSFEGDHSVHFYGLVEQYAFSTITTTIDADKITPGGKYELSFWTKHDSLALFHSGWIDFFPVTSRLYQMDGPRKSTDWIQLTTSFNIPADTDPIRYVFQFHFVQIFNQIAPDIPLNVWIDNIELKRNN